MTAHNLKIESEIANRGENSLNLLEKIETAQGSFDSRFFGCAQARSLRMTLLSYYEKRNRSRSPRSYS